jgi:hypothetical protein
LLLLGEGGGPEALDASTAAMNVFTCGGAKGDMGKALGFNAGGTTCGYSAARSCASVFEDPEAFWRIRWAAGRAVDGLKLGSMGPKVCISPMGDTMAPLFGREIAVGEAIALGLLRKLQ